MHELSEKTREEYIRRLAKNRYDMRMAFNWKEHETAEDDWRMAEEQVRQEEMRLANNG